MGIEGGDWHFEIANTEVKHDIYWFCKTMGTILGSTAKNQNPGYAGLLLPPSAAIPLGMTHLSTSYLPNHEARARAVNGLAFSAV